MKPWIAIDQATARDGTVLSLVRRGDEWAIRCDGRPLMSSRQHGSEEALAQLGLEAVAKPSRVFIGGLGLGFTARAALDRLPRDAELVVAEFSPAIIRWNREHLGAIAGHPLDDPRVELLEADAVAHLYRETKRYDAILLDIDNGPTAMVRDANDRLYSEKGVAACFAAIKPGGAFAVWSAGPDDAYLRRLGKGGFDASAKSEHARGEQGGNRHVIFVGKRKK